MRMFRLLSVLVCGLGLFHASAAKAQSVESEHDGLFFRLNAGPSYFSLSNSDSKASTSGVGYGFSLAAGHTISDNLMLFAEFAMDSVSEPSTSIDGGKSETEKKLTLSSTRYGAGVAYYFMPINAYVSGSLLLGSFKASQENISASSETGFGAKLGVGKEWMLAPKFGLGAVATYSFLSAKGSKEATSASLNSIIGLALSGTYN